LDYFENVLLLLHVAFSCNLDNPELVEEMEEEELVPDKVVVYQILPLQIAVVPLGNLLQQIVAVAVVEEQDFLQVIEFIRPVDFLFVMVKVSLKSYHF
jgi:hypothetical protein